MRVYAYVSSETCTIRRAYLPGSTHPKTDEPIHKHGDFNRWVWGKRDTLKMADPKNYPGAHNSYQREAARLVAERLGWQPPQAESEEEDDSDDPTSVLYEGHRKDHERLARMLAKSK